MTSERKKRSLSRSASVRERAATRPSRVKNQKERKDEEMARRRERASRPPRAERKAIKINPAGLDVRGAIKELEAILRQQGSGGYSRTYRK